jgi:glycosyltransferase involved in cell wall biosynthesis
VNILFIAYNVNIHSRTGDAVHVLELVSNLALLDNKVSLVVGFDAESKENVSILENDPNVHIHYVNNPKFKYFRSKDLSILSWCIAANKRNYYDIIYERNFSCRIGAILSNILKIPLILEINGLVDEEAEMQGKNISLSKKIVGKNFRKLFYLKASKFIVVSAGIKKEMNEQYNIPLDKIAIVPNGANTKLFKPVDIINSRVELGLSHQYKYICFVGNLVRWQGIDYLIRAAPIVLEKVPEARFLIVGDGNARSALEKMVESFNLEKQFLFIGSVPLKMVPKYINASDVCVAPFTRSRNEKIGLSPLKLYEYMACGKPIVASNIPGVGDLLEITKAGIAFTPENHFELADSLIRLISDSNLMEILGRNSQQVSKEYSWTRTAQNVISICTKVKTGA